MSTHNRFPDPLRSGGEQVMMIAQLFCVVCNKDLSGVNCPGIVDLQSGKAYCCADHWMLRKERKSL